MPPLAVSNSGRQTLGPPTEATARLPDTGPDAGRSRSRPLEVRDALALRCEGRLLERPPAAVHTVALVLPHRVCAQVRVRRDLRIGVLDGVPAFLGEQPGLIGVVRRARVG